MGRGPGGRHSGLVTLASIPLTSQNRPRLLPADGACHWADLWSTTRREPLTERQLWAPGTKLPPPRCSQLAGLADWVRAGCLAHGSQACPQATRETRDQTEAVGPEKRQRVGKQAWKGDPLLLPSPTPSCAPADHSVPPHPALLFNAISPSCSSPSDLLEMQIRGCHFLLKSRKQPLILIKRKPKLLTTANKALHALALSTRSLPLPSDACHQTIVFFP